jgi:hypothetical protein
MSKRDNSQTGRMLDEIRSLLTRARDSLALAGEYQAEGDVDSALTLFVSLEEAITAPTPVPIPTSRLAPTPQPSVGVAEFAKEFLVLSTTPAATYSNLSWSYERLARALREDYSDEGVVLAVETLKANYLEAVKALGMFDAEGARKLRVATRAYKLETD